MRKEKQKELKRAHEDLKNRKEEVEAILLSLRQKEDKPQPYIRPFDIMEIPKEQYPKKGAMISRKNKDHYFVISTAENSSIKEIMNVFWEKLEEKVSSTGIKLSGMEVREVLISLDYPRRPAYCKGVKKPYNRYYKILY